MDWLGFIVSAVIGALVGIVVQNVLFPSLQERWVEWRRKRYFRTANSTWKALEELHPRLVLVQGGWDQRGCFAEGSITLTLSERTYEPPPEILRLKKQHTTEWLEQGFTDGEQAGISKMLIRRLNDSPTAELAGLAHSISIESHVFSFFNYLATHQLLLYGDEAEREIVSRIAGFPDARKPIPDFPNPCSVGLSLVCEHGTQLVLTRRSGNIGTGGYWEPLKIYNAVGENTTIRDFSSVPGGPSRTTPTIVAKRGLYEEMGFAEVDYNSCDVQIHSLAWASDIRDHKFFGFAITRLSSAEVEDRWLKAPDRSESSGTKLSFIPMGTRDECLRILSMIVRNPDDWAPEAVFCTLRSMIVLGRVERRDLAGLPKTGGRPR